jgi:polyhydroxybutyrate depolymerase
VLPALALVALLAGCPEEAPVAPPDAGSADGGVRATLGGARPVRMSVPDAYDGVTPLPLIVLLHGHGVSGRLQDAYWQLSAYTSAHGIFTLAPDGRVDAAGERYWDANDLYYTGGDEDVVYLMGLVDEAERLYAIDPSAVYFVGHSNGGLMSYRLACDHADRIAAIGVMAGTTWVDESRCGATEPVSVLHIHGTADDLVPFDGNATMPGARETIERWATRAGCDLATTVDGAPFDLETSIPGPETTVLEWQAGCAPGIGLELWTIPGGQHIPAIASDYAERLVAWLLAHRKPAP